MHMLYCASLSWSRVFVTYSVLTSYLLVARLAGTNLRLDQMPGKHRFPLEWVSRLCLCVCVCVCAYVCVCVCVRVRACVCEREREKEGVHVKSSSALFPAGFLSTAGLIAVSSCDSALSLSALISECRPAESIEALADTATSLPVYLSALQSDEISLLYSVWAAEAPSYGEGWHDGRLTLLRSVQ